jgi:putative ABC transport system permease protein
MPVKTNYKENIAIALTSIKGNKLRTSLTALIIAIGIMALVGILTAIEGIKQQTNTAFAGLGANSFTIQNSGSDLNFGNGGHSKVYPPISYEQSDRFKTTFKLPVRITVNLNVSGTAVAKYGNRKTDPNVFLSGTNENYMATSGYKLAFGRNFSSSELTHGSNVVIIGNDIKDKLFKDQDAIDKQILIGPNRFKIIGIFAKKGSSMGIGPGDRFCIIPVLRAKQIDTIGNPTFNVTVMVNTPEALDASIGEATSLFRNIRDLRISEEDNFHIDRSDSIQKQLAGQLAGMTVGGFAIGIITLIGAAIGLMNIMLVSVTERTREIGLRKAIGATPAIIRKQFLIEAIVICLIGGISGIFLGMLIGNVMVLFTKGSFVVPWLWIGVALCVCTGIGLLSGFYPAKKASKLDPVESLRYE